MREIADKNYTVDGVTYSLYEIGITLNGYQMHQVVRRINAVLEGTRVRTIHFYSYTGRMEHLKMLVMYENNTNISFRDLSDSDFDIIARAVCDVFAERKTGNFLQQWYYKNA